MTELTHIVDVNVADMAQALLDTGDYIMANLLPVLGLTEEEVEGIAPGDLWLQAAEQMLRYAANLEEEE